MRASALRASLKPVQTPRSRDADRVVRPDPVQAGMQMAVKEMGPAVATRWTYPFSRATIIAPDLANA
jgi:hypothetical protein